MSKQNKIGMDTNLGLTGALKSPITTVALILVFLLIFFNIMTGGGFFSQTNLYNILMQMSIIGVITVAQCFVIITAGIDLSQGAIIGLTTIVSSMCMVDFGVPIPVAIAIGLALGTAIGAVNGILSAKLGIPAFIATLGTMSIVEASALLSKGGNDIYNLPQGIAEFGRGGIGGIIPHIAIIMIIVAVVAHILLKKTSFGRYVYAVGSNIQAAKFSGINVNSVLFKTYIIAGFLCALAGIIMMTRINGGVAVAGRGYQMNSIAAVVIGGGSLFGGEGSIVGAMIGAGIMTVLSNGLQLMGVSSYWQQFITGIVLVIAVLMDTIRRKHSLQ